MWPTCHPHLAQLIAHAVGHSRSSARSTCSWLLTPTGAGVCTQDGCAPLHLAAAGGHTRAMKVLLVCGVHVDQRTVGGETALLTAARRAHMEAVKLLLEHGADVNLRSEEQKRSTLQWVVGHAQTEVAEALLHAGAEVGPLARLPSRGSTKLAGMSTRPAGLNPPVGQCQLHPQGTAPLTYLRSPRLVRYGR